MARSERLRLSDVRQAVRQAVRLAGECRELGHDPDGWLRHLGDGLARLVNAGNLFAVEYLPGGPRGFTLTRSFIHGGLTPAMIARFADWSRHPEQPPHVALARVLALPHPVLVRAGFEVESDAEWAVDPYRHELLHPHGLDDGMIGRGPAGGRAVLSISPIRSRGEPRFGRRERRVYGLVHAELAPLFGRRLATGSDPVARLTPRQRQVLDCLLDGDGEKQAAARLGVRPGTVHEHVKRVYRQFGVASRAELLAHFLRRSRGR